MILIDRELRAMLRQDEFGLEPFDDALVQPSSIDLRLDSLARVVRVCADAIDSRSEMLEREYEDVHISSEEGYILEPRGCLLVQTYERMRIPTTCQGQIAERSSLVRLGLSVTSSLINPGYAGRLPCTLTNLSGRPIRIYPGVPFCQLVLHRCVGRPDIAYHEKPDAKYHDEQSARPSALHRDVRRWHPAPRLVHPEQVSELRVDITEEGEQ